MSARARLTLRLVVAAAGSIPWLLAIAHVRSPAFVTAFHTLCHQRLERTLIVFGAPMVVCSRCAGLYAGLFAGTVFPLPRRWLDRGRTLVLVTLALTLLEIALQDLGLHAPWHATRLLTGFALGWSATAFFTAAALGTPPAMPPPATAAST